MFRKILIANRGEIAVRISRTAHRMGIASVAVYSDADRDAMHVAAADEAYRIGPAPAAESYLKIDAIMEAARVSDAAAIHPGYGFLSENPALADACAAAGIVFIGPPASAIRAMGLKDAAKRLMIEAGVPVVPGYHGENQDARFLERQADEVGYPVLIKARAGGGGKGMRRVESPAEFGVSLESARREAQSSFGDGAVLIEKYVTKPRHIEIQVFADGHGNTVHLFERDCSLQRRHQKVIEEAPAPGMPPEMRDAMGQAAVKAASAVGYRGAGTVEFIADASAGLRLDRFYFMEMNTRLQVEHRVTEAIVGHDLVEWQFRVADGEPLPVKQGDLRINGHAVEARLYAEDATRNFMPATGRLDVLHLPDDLARIDTGVREGDTVTPFYDPMIAKIIVHAETRDEALNKLSRALGETRAVGCVTNAAFLKALIGFQHVRDGDVDTGLIERNIAALGSIAAPDSLAFGLGALVALGLTTLPEKADPWDVFRHFRLWSEASYSIVLIHDGKPQDVGVTILGQDRYRFSPLGMASTDAAIMVAGPGHLSITKEGRATKAVFAQTARGGVAVFIDGNQFAFTAPAADAISQDDASSGGNRIVAAFPGIVKIVSAKVGDAVKKGDALIVMEAMKMDHTLAAPRDGQVAEVLTAPGAQVSEGALLLVLDDNNA